MAELTDDRPLFFLVMGCNGAGKTAWKRDNYDSLPKNYYDLDSWAGGIGDWDDPDIRDRVLRAFEAALDQHIERRESFGCESTYSGRRGKDLVERLSAEGYRIEGYYIGTASHDINIARIAKRVRERTGHQVNASVVPDRWRFSLSNLRKTAEAFDLLEIADNSLDLEQTPPLPAMQCVLERGRIVQVAPQVADWCRSWLEGLEQRQRSLARVSAKRRRAEERESPSSAPTVHKSTAIRK